MRKATVLLIVLIALHMYANGKSMRTKNPTVTLINPQDDAIVSPNLTFEYRAADVNGIKNASLYINGVRNQSINYLNLYYNDTERIWAEKLKQRVNSTCPLTIAYDEYTETNTTRATPELLWGVVLYKITGNKTYLSGALEVANWLKKTENRQFLIFPLNPTTGKRASSSTTGMLGYPILILAEINALYMDLAEWYVKELHRIFSNKNTNLLYASVDENENVANSIDQVGRYKPMTFAYIYNLTGDETYKQWLRDWTDAFWNRKTSENITPGYLDANDFSVPFTMIKEDQHFGRWLLNLEMFYYYTRDYYYKSIIKDVANAVSKWIWYPEKNRFRYYVIWNNPSYGSTNTVHGFSLLDIGMINAYLLWGNQTWLNYARSDYDELIVKGKILSHHNLIYHAITASDNVFNPEANWYWNKYAVQAGYMLYLITKNQIYLDSIKTLHQGVYDNQWGTRGYIDRVNAVTLAEYEGAKSVNLEEIPHIIYPNLLADREQYGDTYMANDEFDKIFEEYGEMKYMNPKENFGMGYFRIKNLAEREYTWNIKVYDTIGKEGWGDQRSFIVSAHAPWKTSFIGLDNFPIVDFAAYKGSLYSASNNLIYVFNGKAWEIIEAPIYTLSLAIYKGTLLLAGEGGIYSYNQRNFAQILSGSTYYKILGTYRNKLYAGTILDKTPTLYYCRGSADNPDNWHVDAGFSITLDFSGPIGSIDSSAVYKGRLYIASGGTVYSYNGVEWSIAKTYDDVHAYLDMKIYQGKLYLATRDKASRKPLYLGYSGFSGRIIEFDGNNWTTILDHDYWIYALETYERRLYVGTAGKVYEYHKESWKVSFNPIKSTQHAISLVTYKNRIYVGTSNGYIYEYSGPKVSTNRIPPIRFVHEISRHRREEKETIFTRSSTYFSYKQGFFSSVD